MRAPWGAAGPRCFQLLSCRTRPTYYAHTSGIAVVLLAAVHQQCTSSVPVQCYPWDLALPTVLHQHSCRLYSACACAGRLVPPCDVQVMMGLKQCPTNPSTLLLMGLLCPINADKRSTPNNETAAAGALTGLQWKFGRHHRKSTSCWSCTHGCAGLGCVNVFQWQGERPPNPNRTLTHDDSMALYGRGSTLPEGFQGSNMECRCMYVNSGSLFSHLQKMG